jgi:hypothetical protein
MTVARRESHDARARALDRVLERSRQVAGRVWLAPRR